MLFQENPDEANEAEKAPVTEENDDTEALAVAIPAKPDPLKQLLQCLNRAATTAQVFSITEDIVYLSYSTIMSKVKFRRKKKKLKL